MESLSVVFPMYNEKEYIQKTITKTVGVLQNIVNDYEIIIVDDASLDGSGQIADELARQNQRIKVIHHKNNRKLGGALKTGFNVASKEFVLYSDIDMPFDFKEVKTALSIIHEQGADLVSVYRLNRKIDGVKRHIYSIVYNGFIRLVFGLKIKDVNFSFKLARAEVIKKMNLCSEGSFIDAEMLIKAKRMKAKIVQFGTLYFPRKSGVSRLSGPGIILKILKEAFIFRAQLFCGRG